MAEYELHLEDLDSYSQKVLEFKDKVDEYTGGLEGAVSLFVADSGFEGQAADSMKSYANEVYTLVATTLRIIVERYCADVGKYAGELQEAPISEDRDAVLVSEGYSDAHDKLAALTDTAGLPSIEAKVSDASALVESANVSVQFPSKSQQLRNTIDTGLESVDQAAQAIDAKEDEGLQLAAQTDSYAKQAFDVLSGLRSRGWNLAAYNAGDIGEISGVGQLVQNLTDAEMYLSANSERIEAFKAGVLSRQKERFDEEQERQLATKRNWALFGTAAKIAGVVAGAALLVATFPVSTAALVFSVASLGVSAIDAGLSAGRSMALAAGKDVDTSKGIIDLAFESAGVQKVFQKVAEGFVKYSSGVAKVAVSGKAYYAASQGAKVAKGVSAAGAKEAAKEGKSDFMGNAADLGVGVAGAAVKGVTGSYVEKKTGDKDAGKAMGSLAGQGVSGGYKMAKGTVEAVKDARKLSKLKPGDVQGVAKGTAEVAKGASKLSKLKLSGVQVVAEVGSIVADYNISKVDKELEKTYAEQKKIEELSARKSKSNGDSLKKMKAVIGAE